LRIDLSINKISFERTNYTLLNFVGDIGALYSALTGIASLILTLLRTDVVMENHLLNQVFTERPLDHTQPPIPLKITFYC
jgi:hypothetical protein